ncbi:hypothetical protein DYB36_008153 [Aphanomyces astaci]|uniref:DNA2/NAM7 helicase-like C-terminal domain-containing protein n=2 Tax=Aphanomyces astaci TaxID=112090 RepID=A0A397BEI6_APHAT|nr:hypothetical protein DYB36_008153 [Aphanomyces astaci]
MVRRSMEAHGRVVKETQDTLESSFLESAHIVFTTLSSAGHRALDDSSRYDILVIDEAAQAVELSTIIPMRFGSRQCVLVGDPQQLSATVFSRTSAQSLYERSLFERLESCGHPVHMLRTHHPTISAFPRQYFYGGLLQDGDNVRQPTYAKMYHGLAPAFKPLVFWNLVSSREAMSSMSRTNPMEVKLAVNLYLTLRNSCPPDAIRGKVGVITPYAAQMDELKRAFTVACNGEFHHDVEINTVDGYQGREKDIIIRVGFLNDIRRMNVALTRAKFACYVLGSEAALQNSTPWAALLDHARGTGCLVNVPNPQENLFTLVPAPPGPPRGVSPPRIDAGAEGEAADEEAVDEGDLADVGVVKATNRLIRNTTPLRTNSTNSFHIPHTNNSRNPHTTHLHPPHHHPIEYELFVDVSDDKFEFSALGDLFQDSHFRLQDSFVKSDVFNALPLPFALKVAYIGHIRIEGFWGVMTSGSALRCTISDSLFVFGANQHIDWTDELQLRYAHELAVALLHRLWNRYHIEVWMHGASAILSRRALPPQVPVLTEGMSKVVAIDGLQVYTSRIPTTQRSPDQWKALFHRQWPAEVHVAVLVPTDIKVKVDLEECHVTRKLKTRAVDLHVNQLNVGLDPQQVVRADVDPAPLVIVSFNVLPHIQPVEPTSASISPVRAPFPARAMWKYAVRCVLQDVFPKRRDAQDNVLWLSKLILQYTDLYKRKMGSTYVEYVVRDLLVQHKQGNPSLPPVLPTVTSLVDRIIRQEFIKRNAKQTLSDLSRGSSSSVVRRGSLERLGRVHSFLKDESAWNLVDVEAVLFDKSTKHLMPLAPSAAAVAASAQSSHKTDVMTDVVQKYQSKPMVHADIGHIRFAFRHVDAAHAPRKKEWEFNCEFLRGCAAVAAPPVLFVLLEVRLGSVTASIVGAPDSVRKLMTGAIKASLSPCAVIKFQRTLSSKLHG